jgi:DNA-binding LytR/AlgR family response regulator
MDRANHKAMKYNCLIVDDEPLARSVMRNHIAALDMLNLSGECANALAAFHFLQNESVDLMFLDIQMPKVNGIDFLRSLKNPPKTVLTTAFSDYALEGFDLDVVDYLLKPVAFNRFLRAIQKAFRHDDLATFSFLQESEEESQACLFLRVDRKILKVSFQDILYIEALKDYVKVVTKTQRIVAKHSLNALTESLPVNFVRVHRSFLINAVHLRSWNRQQVQVAEVNIPVGRFYRPAWVQFMQEKMG